MALEAISQDGRTQRRNGRLPPSAHSKGINGESKAPDGNLLGQLANFGQLGPALSAQIPLFHHWPDRLEQSCHAVSASAQLRQNRGTRPKSDASKCLQGWCGPSFFYALITILRGTLARHSGPLFPMRMLSVISNPQSSIHRPVIK